MSDINQIENHPGYWPGMEHDLFFRTLRSSLEKGPDRFVKETDRRAVWFKDGAHYFPEMYLVGVFAYLESQLNKGWIAKFASEQVNELFVLRIVRNAVTHEAGNIKALDPYKPPDVEKGRPEDKEGYVRDFIRRLENGEITFQRQPSRKIPVQPYIELSDEGIVQLTDPAFDRIYTLATNTLRNAGVLKPPAPS